MTPYLRALTLAEHDLKIKVHRRRPHEVFMDGAVIGTIVAEAVDGRREWIGRLTGYAGATYSGPGKLAEVAEELVLHELDQRITNPRRLGLQL